MTKQKAELVGFFFKYYQNDIWTNTLQISQFVDCIKTRTESKNKTKISLKITQKY